MKIGNKVIALSLAVSLTVALVAGFVLVTSLDMTVKESLSNLSKTLRDDYDRNIRFQVEQAVSMLKAIADSYPQDEAGQALAREQGAKLLRALRYNTEGYFWADTPEGINVVLLGKEIEGKSRIDQVDAKGTPIVKNVIHSGLQEGGGFTDYEFPKPDAKEDSPKRSYSILFKPFNWVIGTGNYIDDIDNTLKAKQVAFETHIVSTRFAAMAALLIVFVGIGFVSMLFGKKISKPIHRMSLALTDIARGEADLTRLIDDQGKGELGLMASAFNEFTGKLSSIISAIRVSMEQLRNTGHDLTSSLVQTSAALNQITANVQSMSGRISSQAVSVTETSATVEQIGKRIQNLNEVIDEQARSVSQSSAAIEQMVANLTAVSRSMDAIDNIFKRLVTASDTGKSTIDKVNNLAKDIQHKSETLRDTNVVISSIAAQTNLLAMNAAIEAAHAGEAGRGFSVVADEIRKLAENAALQSKAVAQNIKQINASINDVVGSSHEAEKAFDLTINLIREVDALENEVKASMAEQNEGSAQILQELSRIKDITVNVQSGALEMKQGSGEILLEVRKLHDITTEINQGMDEINAGTREINQAVNAISDLGLQNKQAIESVDKETARFKIRI